MVDLRQLSFLRPVQLFQVGSTPPCKKLTSSFITSAKQSGLTKRIFQNNVKDKQPPWFDKECDQLKKRKFRLLKLFRRENDINILNEYKATRALFKNLFRNKRKCYYESVHVFGLVPRITWQNKAKGLCSLSKNV